LGSGRVKLTSDASLKALTINLCDVAFSSGYNVVVKLATWVIRYYKLFSYTLELVGKDVTPT
jgi:hypothetical protein